MNSRIFLFMLLAILVTTMVRLGRHGGGQWFLAYQIQLGVVAFVALLGLAFPFVANALNARGLLDLDDPHVQRVIFGLNFMAWGLFAAFVLLPALLLSQASHWLAAGRVRGAARLWHAASFCLWGKLGQRYNEYSQLFSSAFNPDADAMEKQLDTMLAQPQPASLRGSLLAFKFLIYSLRHDWQKAVAFYEATGNWGSSETAVTARLQAARAYAELGNFPEAVGHLNRALSDPQSMKLGQSIFLTRTAIFALAGDVERLRALFRKHRRELRRTPHAYRPYWFGRCHMMRGERAEAAMFFQEARKAVPRHHTRWRDAVDARIATLEAAVNLQPHIYAQTESYARALAVSEQAEEKNRPLKILLNFTRPAAAVTLLALLLFAIHVAQPFVYDALVRRFGEEALQGKSVTKFFENRADMPTSRKFFMDLFANSPVDVRFAQYWRVFTSIFLHDGWMHLCLNVIALLAFGSAIERLWGRTRMVLMFLIAGIGGNLLRAWLTSSREFSIGASGGVFGLMAAYWISMMTLDMPDQRRFKMRLVLLVSIVILIDLSLGFLTENETMANLLDAHIDNWAHAGGLLVGLALGWILKPTKNEAHRAFEKG